MAQYKVPQDVEAEDKLLGPFTFRQFIYLMVAAGCIALAVALFRLFPLLAIIPAPIAIFFAVLALPLKKDQPMETYLAAIISYHLKPRKRIWTPGQRESTILITAPKKIEAPRARDITGEEASHRLSFLANVIDTEGYAIQDSLNNTFREDFVAENSDVVDMMDNYSSPVINQMVNQNTISRHDQIVQQMREAIAAEEAAQNQQNPYSRSRISHDFNINVANPSNLYSVPTAPSANFTNNNNVYNIQAQTQPVAPQPIQSQPQQVQQIQSQIPQSQQQPQPVQTPQQPQAQPIQQVPTNPEPAEEKPKYQTYTGDVDPLSSSSVIQPFDKVERENAERRAAVNKARLTALANNPDFSIETIAKEADRVVPDNSPSSNNSPKPPGKSSDNEIFVSLQH